MKSLTVWGMLLIAASFADATKITTPAIDANLLALEAEGRSNLVEAPRFAVPFDTQVYSPETHGLWEATADGWNVWRLVIECPGAVHVNLGFSYYHMPEGGSLLISNAGNATQTTTTTSTTFTSADNAVHGELWTPIYLGDTVELEVALPPSVPVSSLLLDLFSINAGFRGFGGDVDFAKSGSCNVDVVCKEGDAWRDEISSVAVYSQGGSRFCTGALINTVVGDGTPYFLTAYHCGINDNTQARSLVVYWNYQTSSCGQTPNGSLSQFQQGATFVAGWATSDFSLLRLNNKPNEEWNIHYAGFDRSGAAMSSAVAIHHPQAQEKRISFENDPTSPTNWYSNTVSTTGTHIRVTDWDLGTTEPGSSGSPLFDPNHRIVGQLHGGDAACGNNDSDWYGRLFRSWEGAGTPTRRLKDWLDPANTGAMTVNTALINPSAPTPPAPTPPAPTPPAPTPPAPTPQAPTPPAPTPPAPTPPAPTPPAPTPPAPTPPAPTPPAPTPPAPTPPAPTPPTVPAPTPGRACFSERNTVVVMGVGSVPIQDVRIGDMVLVDGQKFEPIYSFCKRAPEASGEFIQVFSPDIKAPLELTGNHLVFIQKKSRQVSVSASKLQVGDMILHENGHYVSVSKLQSVLRNGAFAPYTASGTIVVNGILASTYATIDKGILSKDSQRLLHFAQTHHRVLCRYFSNWCGRETYSESGLSPISELSLNLYEFVSAQSMTIVKWGGLVTIVIGLLLLYALESANIVVILLLLLLISVSWRIKYLQRRTRTNYQTTK